MPSKSLFFFSLLLPISLYLLKPPMTTPQTQRAPVMFVSHGGPPTLFDTQHSAYKEWKRIGKVLKEEKDVKGIVMVSAHWQAEELEKGVFVNNDETNPLIYDFYNFPKHFYEQQFKSSNPSSFSTSISKHLQSHGISTTFTKRGLDHGVWVPLLVSFSGELDSSIPLCQVSLPRSEDPVDSLKLGLALRGLREQGIAVLGGGQAVHNLRDFMKARMNGGLIESPAYAKTFPPALKDAMTQAGDQNQVEKPTGDHFDVNQVDEPTKWKAVKELFNRKDFKGAHPTPEHLLPALVALGASYDDEQGKEIFDLDEGALGWNMYQWG